MRIKYSEIRQLSSAIVVDQPWNVKVLLATDAYYEIIFR